MAKAQLNNQEVTVDALLEEKRTFKASDDFRARAFINDAKLYDEAKKNPEAFWAKCAEKLDWIKKWDKTLEWTPPFSKWFVGGKLNACYNCVDRHIKNGL